MPPSALPNPRGPSPADLQSHLYTSFLNRKTADVALRVQGSWHAVYNLHRVVLIQAGFFQSLFTGGFSESKGKLVHCHSGPDVIDIVFDDPNITRPAFEICIARLYGGGPPLHIPSSMIPTPSFPLTPSFPSSSPAASSTPAGHHLATPRLLLSLLATSVFLAIPSVAAPTLAAVLRTIGPRSAVRYLNFAIGAGMGEPEEGELDAAVGLEGVAEIIKEEDEVEDEPSQQRDAESGASDKSPQHTLKRPPSDSSVGHSSESDHFSVQKEDPGASEATDAESSRPHAEQSFFYGSVSNKVGEAAACWLARWGVDLLQYEQAALESAKPPRASSLLSPWSAMQSQMSRRRSTTVPSRFADSAEWHPGAGKGRATDVEDVPLVWRRGGLSARWVRGLLSSDALFVRGERERYDMARTVVEMRRAEGVLEEEEREWDVLFAEGIYYANMTLDDLMMIAQDMSPSTGKPYVPQTVLQSAHWNASVLRHKITVRTPGTTSPAPRDKELGISKMTKDLADLPDQDAPHYPVPSDSSMRLGDIAGLEGASMEQLFDLAAASFDAPAPTGNDAPSPTAKKPSAQPAAEANFFGLQQARTPASVCAHVDAGGKARWTAHPPMRFAVEFWDVDALKEKSRLHSHTVWYAGSLYNVYVQVVRKKGVQLGVYLHRQSSVDPIPPPSIPAVAASMSRGERGHTRGASASATTGQRPSSSSGSGNYSSSTLPLSRSTTPQSSPVSPTTGTPSSLPNNLPQLATGAGVTLPATGAPVMPQQPYRDPRTEVRAYFTIACASATGASLTRFTSSPDDFRVSQSWGWKSSSLRTEEFMEVGPDGEPLASATTGLPAGREISLRATVVLGVV
ncbi:hypothetical protein OBBRIDRAFT_790967 [Obba rivulosa]|uniref:BTB domain-containing protein n=1 Tax=Obba rivulosa TaxID=1052685 RepID=A0A8E2B5U3_9APHY|nr:hypothetical protein OBBRIDRAFT_790967 [Obba rivulosa]